MVTNLNELKKQVFYDMLDLVGRVFILVRYSDDVVIGKRGFTPAEKEKGLVLVFNKRMNFEWDDSGISVTLVFGSTAESCFVPIDSILSIFSPELSAQFLASPPKAGKSGEKIAEPKTEKRSRGEKVVKVDFKKKK